MGGLTGTTGPWIDVLVMGSPLMPLVADKLVAAEVDLSLFVPSQFKLVFSGSREEILMPSGLQLAAKVTLLVSAGETPVPLMTMADVTAIEVEYGPEGDLTIVKGMDASHRLMRGTTAMTYPDQTASVVVEMLVGKAGIVPGEILPTETVYEMLTQANVSSWVFIQQLAALENCVAYVDNLGMFNFGATKPPEAAVPPRMSYLEPAMSPTQLTMGDNLLRLRGTVGGTEQVPAVTVMGYDPKMSIPVVGMAPTIPSTALSLDPGAAVPPMVAGEMQATPFFEVSRPFDNEGAAETRAMSIAADIAGALAEFEGETVGNPNILAGEIVSLGMVGPPFDGQYLISAARHVFEGELGRYSTWFTVGGRRDRSMYGLTSSSPAIAPSRPHIPGVVVGMVMLNEDPESMGRVQVAFPWLGTTMSSWARIVQMGASKLGGCLWLPEIGDEVLVAFDRGSIDNPYVIGNLYNGLFKPMPGPDLQPPLVGSRRLTSRGLHTIQFDDGPAAMGITIQTGLKGCTIKLDEEQQQITIETLTGTVTMGADGISLEAKTGDVSLKSLAGQVSISGQLGVSIAATGGPASLQGVNASLQGTAAASVQAPSVTLGP